MSSSIGEDFHFVAHLGNIKVLTFQLKQFGSKSALDVSGASQILLEIENPDQVALPNLVASAVFPGADWANGIVKVQISAADVTSLIGTWTAGLTVFLGGEEDTQRTGTIEVKRRPGYPSP